MHIKNWDPAKTLTFIRYLLVGGWNTVFGMAVYAGLYHMIGDSVHYLILLIPSNVLAITNAFACYKFFVFKTKGNVLREYFRCYVVYGGMMLVGAALMFVLVDGLHLPPVIANCMCVAITTVVSYFAHRDFSFNRGSSPSSAPVPATTPPPDATRERMPSERKDIPAEPTMRPSESRKPLVLLCLLSLLALLAHLGFMRSIPLPFMDSVHIHELGRLFLARTVPYASLMVNPDGANATTFFYLGPVLQELMYQVFGFAGPRVFPMLGLLVAAFFCRAWLLKKGTSHWLATTLALMVLSCPVLTQSVRFVRIDTWALALFFATVFLMESATGQSRHAMRNLFFMAGALMSLSLFVWPTSFVFFFFYLANLWTLRTRHCLSGAETAYGFLSLATGGFVMGVLLILPLCTELDKGIYNLRLHFSHCIVGQDLDMASNVFLKIKGGGLCLLKELLRDPILMIIAAIGAASLRKRVREGAVWILCGMTALGVCMATGLYIYRFIYLLPFIFMLAKTGFQTMQKKHQKTAIVLAVSLLFYGFSTSFLAPLTMSCIYKGRSISNITERLRSAIGEGEKRVYVCSFQTYYPARMLGWSFYRYTVGHFLFEDSKYANLLSRVDYVIDSIPSPWGSVVEEGFTFYSLLRDYSIRAAIDLSKNSGLRTGHAANLKDRTKKILANFGNSLVYVPNCETAYAQTEKYFVSQGFEKVCVLDFTPDNSLYSPFERWLLSKQIVNPNYDPLVIWRRSAKPDNRPDQNSQAR